MLSVVTPAITSLVRYTFVPMGIVADGDSITVGYGVAQTMRYSSLAQPLWRGNFGTLDNTATIGIGMVALAARVPGTVVPLINAAHALGHKAVCSCLGGTNDFRLNNVDVPTMVAATTSYFQQCKAAGADVTIGWTVPPFTGFFDGPQVRSNRLTYNDILRSNFHAMHIDQLVDIAADPSMGPQAATLIPQLYFDGTHPNVLGQQIFTSYFARAVVQSDSVALLTGLAPATGPEAGGTTVDVFGSGLFGLTELAIGGIPVASIVEAHDNRIRAVTGAAFGTGPGDVNYIGRNGASRLAGAYVWT